MSRHASEERLGVQITGPTVESVTSGVRLLNDKPFDTVDINMGCPVRKVVGNGCDMAMRPAGRNDHIVAETRFSLKVDGDDIFGLGVFQTGKDCRNGAGHGVVSADPGRRRHDVGLLP